MARHAHPAGGFPHGSFPIWRLVAEKIATLSEIRESWSICDVADANDLLNYWEAEKPE